MGLRHHTRLPLGEAPRTYPRCVVPLLFPESVCVCPSWRMEHTGVPTASAEGLLTWCLSRKCRPTTAREGGPRRPRSGQTPSSLCEQVDASRVPRHLQTSRWLWCKPAPGSPLPSSGNSALQPSLVHSPDRPPRWDRVMARPGSRPHTCQPQALGAPHGLFPVRPGSAVDENRA